MSKKKDKQKEENAEALSKIEEVVEEILLDPRSITITIDSYQNLISWYPAADIKAQCKYLDNDLGETGLVPITDAEDLHINDSFSFQIDAESKNDIDHLISSPAFLTVWQHPGTCDPNLYEQLQKSEDLKVVSSVKSFDSVISIYEAFTGDTIERDFSEISVTKEAKGKKADKGKPAKAAKEKGSKTSKVSAKASKTSAVPKKKDANGQESVKKEEVPVVYGMCAIDFLPLFYETLIVNPLEKFTDERMTTFKTHPKVMITVSIDKELDFAKSVIMNFTIESIYNLPSLMSPEMDFKVCAILPMENSTKEPMLFTNPMYTTKSEEDVMKCWPGIQMVGVNANTTKYKINPDDYIKNTVGSNIDTFFNENNPRMQFNTLKRTLLLKDGMDFFSYQVQTLRKIALEIYMTTRTESANSISAPSATDKKSKGKGSDTASRKSQQFLHLMTILDLSTLLYPGVKKTRLASPLRTFSYEEALKLAGLEDSHFIPKPKVDIQNGKPSEGEGKKGGKGKDKASTSSKDSKKGAKGGEGDTGDLKPLLPPQPEPIPEPEPSTPVFTEDGKPCFIMVEIELSEPINQKRDLVDLNDEFRELLGTKCSKLSKIVLTNCLTKDFYREVLSEITKDIYEKYKKYAEQKDYLKDKSFLKYLHTTGTYQRYLTSITKAASLAVTNKFKYDETDKSNVKLRHNFIGEIFVYLVSEMNDTLNKLIGSGLEPVVLPKCRPLDKNFFYAKEALQLGRRVLAERYFVETICNDEEDKADYWFDYAVYYLEIKDADKAFECVREALLKKPSHRYSLLLFGALLANKEEKDEAETCFLNLLVEEPRWLEGWAVLYLFYQKYKKHEGMDMAQEMLNKYADDKRTVTDYFTEFEDLAWTYKICPKTVFFKTAILLLKMRLYCWVEMALAHEIQKHYGLTHYLLSAICLYQGLYDHALEHIEETKAHYGSDYAVGALSGHCWFALNKYKEAKEEYYHVLESFSRPDDVHMLYVNCAQVLENLGEAQEARKLILLACKHSPTPYTWFKAGQIYFQQNDLLSAEECFSEANYRDNRSPEVWAYLAIINMKLHRSSEAELCYRQALKNKLKCPGLKQLVQEAFGKRKIFATPS